MLWSVIDDIHLMVFILIQILFVGPLNFNLFGKLEPLKIPHYQQKVSYTLPKFHYLRLTV